MKLPFTMLLVLTPAAFAADSRPLELPAIPADMTGGATSLDATCSVPSGPQLRSADPGFNDCMTQSQTDHTRRQADGHVMQQMLESSAHAQGRPAPAADNGGTKVEYKFGN